VNGELNKVSLCQNN